MARPDEWDEVEEVDRDDQYGHHEHYQEHFHHGSDDDDGSGADPYEHNPYAEGGDFAGLSEHRDPEAWAEHIKHMDAEASQRAARMATKAYEERKAKETAELQRARRNAVSKQRIRNGLLNEKYGDTQSEKLVGWMAIPPDAKSIDIERAGDERTKSDITVYNHLRQQYVAGAPLSVGQLNLLRKLHDRLNLTTGTGSPDRGTGKRSARLVENPDKEAKTAAEQAMARRQATVTKRHGSVKGTINPTYRSGSKLVKAGHTNIELQSSDNQLAKPTPEGILAKYGQETTKKLRPSRVITSSDEQGLVEEPVRSGWEATHRFNMDQYKRKLRSLRTGEVSHNAGPIHVGANKQDIIKTRHWSMVQNADTPAQDVYHFELEQKSAKPETRIDSEGKYFVKGIPVAASIKEAGLTDKVQLEALGDGKFKIHTKQGVHLNPDEIAALQEQLHVNHGLVKGSWDPKVQAQWRQKSTRIQRGQKLPDDIKEEDILASSWSRPMYKNGIGVQYGERDPITGELLKGQTDSAGISVGKFAVSKHFKEDTDAIGWGTSWRPGNKEISAAVLALPRARRDRKIFEANQALERGDSGPMEQLIAQEHPELETDAERDDQLRQYRRHAKELGSAAVLSTYYSTKKGLPRRITGKAYAYSTKIPKVGPKIKTFATNNSLEDIWHDLNWTKRPLVAKMDRAHYRIHHPLGDPNDPTMAGIYFEHGKINIPQIRYRKYFVRPWDKKARVYEKQVKVLESSLKSRELMDDYLHGTSRNPLRNIQVRSALRDPDQGMTDHLIERINVMRGTIGGEMAKSSISMGRHEVDMKSDEGKLYKAHLEGFANDLKAMQRRIATHPNRYTHQGLERSWDNYYRDVGTREIAPKVLKGARYGLAGAAVVGGGALAVDRYQTYRVNKGHNIDHPVLNTLVPERIMYPKLSVKKTHEYRIPHNAFTEAVDLDGHAVPVGWRASVHKEEKIRLRNHRDITGEGYKKNLPILGGVGLAPAKTEGSVTKGILRPSARAGIGPTKNMYVAGHKVPVDISIGRKERWDNKTHRLRAKNNPYRLDQDDREKLVIMARESPQQEAQIRAFYHGDTKLEELLDKPVEFDDTTGQDKLIKKHKGFVRNKLTTISDVAGGKGVGVSQDRSRTVEEYADVRNMYRDNRRNQKRERSASQSRVRTD